jgi:sugar fermentation stimulation protein A
VTYTEDGVARFPDAVSARGARHARHLAELARSGHPTMILFVIQRDDARLFRPMWDRDPDLGHALHEADEAGVDIRAISMSVTPEIFTCVGEVPVDLTPPNS